MFRRYDVLRKECSCDSFGLVPVGHGPPLTTDIMFGYQIGRVLTSHLDVSLSDPPLGGRCDTISTLRTKDRPAQTARSDALWWAMTAYCGPPRPSTRLALSTERNLVWSFFANNWQSRPAAAANYRRRLRCGLFGFIRFWCGFFRSGALNDRIKWLPD